MHDLKNKYPGSIYLMSGLHPTDVKENYKEELEFVVNSLKSHSYVAVGEIGIDLYWDKSLLKQQQMMAQLRHFFRKPTLTSLSKTCGWAAKLNPVGLKNLLSSLPQQADPNLLVGFETSDDAGVYQLNDTQAIVTTADFITPPTDDPRLFGQIAAANALSDVYAMGGRPLTCLNLLAFPANKLRQEILHGIIAGAAGKILEAGAVSVSYTHLRAHET